ncbi:hypothetical protein [Tellurirhabdus rosea]|uniref:hypothetical protein n=1 Tax=Tellurirhabdus rosea TaxID=2674997 RepID=UPI00225C2A62|nr:hypothetical protein [Tellurirhabdus rosea]
MNTYLAVHFREFAATAKEFDSLVEAHNHLLFKSSLLKMSQTDLMAVYRKSDGMLMGTVRPLSSTPAAKGALKLGNLLRELF